MPATALRPPPSLIRAWERHARVLPRLIETLLVILLALALAQLFWKLVPVPESAVWSAPPAPPSPASVAASRGPNVDLVAEAHLFGQYQAPAEQDLSELEEAPDTQLDLTLLGILAATMERGSRALINASNGEEKPFAIGDDVVRNVTLQAIFPDRVILSRNGKLETLRLDKNAPPRSLRSQQRSEEVAFDSEDEYTDQNTSLLSDIREELLADPSRASDYIRVQPASSGGQLRGYRIYPGRNREAFSSAGLRPGDLVTQVNGIQLNDANTALQMLGQISSANSLTVVIERGGQVQTLNVNF